MPIKDRKKKYLQELAWKKANPDKVKENRRKHYLTHKDESREQTRKWRKINPEKANELSRKYKERNREIVRFRDKERKAKLRNDDPEKFRLKHRDFFRKNPDKAQQYRHARRAHKVGNGGKFTAKEFRALKAAYNNCCLCCGMPEPEIKLVPDHVIPLAKGGSNGIENIQPLCGGVDGQGGCNGRKGVKIIDYRPHVSQLGRK